MTFRTNSKPRVQIGPLVDRPATGPDGLIYVHPAGISAYDAATATWINAGGGGGTYGKYWISPVGSAYNTPYNTLTDAMAAAVLDGTSNPVFLMYPGNYLESALLQDFMSVQGVGDPTAVRISRLTLVALVGRSSVSNLSVLDGITVGVGAGAPSTAKVRFDKVFSVPSGDTRGLNVAAGHDGVEIYITNECSISGGASVPAIEIQPKVNRLQIDNSEVTGLGANNSIRIQGMTPGNLAVISNSHLTGSVSSQLGVADHIDMLFESVRFSLAGSTEAIGAVGLGKGSYTMSWCLVQGLADTAPWFTGNGRLRVNPTEAGDSTAVPGDATINKPLGRSAFAALGAQSIVITNNLVRAGDFAFCQLETLDGTLTSVVSSCTDNTITLTGNAVATNKTIVAWELRSKS